ncbi:MAG: cysteine desulfurase family protein [Armatimonadota bacterium]
MRRIYLDYAATTPVLPEVVEAMLPYQTCTFGNPSSQHWYGRQARAATDAARDTVARILGCSHTEVVFTASGSEANNLALRGVALDALQRFSRPPRIVTSAVEHHSVLHTAEALRAFRCEVAVLPVDRHGMVCPDDLERALAQPTTLVSIMTANNEVGTVQPIAELCRVAHTHGALFHTDAVQAAGTLPIDLGALSADLLTVSAHKFYGPKGAAALIVRSGVRLQPLIIGGTQERERRAGTENVPAIVGMARALEIAVQSIHQESARLAHLRDRLVSGIIQRIDRTHLNGHPTQRLPGLANLAFDCADGETILLNLDLAGVACSGGSACASGAMEPSHVLLAMGLPRPLASAAVRITLGRHTTDRDIEAVLEILPEAVSRARAVWKPASL